MAEKRNKSPLPANTSVLFVTFSKWDKNKRTPANGSLVPLRDFLLPLVKKLVIIDQVHPSGDGIMPVIEEYNNHKNKVKKHQPSWVVKLLSPWLSMPHTNPSGTYISFKVRDFISVFDWAFRDSTKFDYCICLESINTLAAIILKKLGRVKKVVYYVSDYSPKRYPSEWFNNLYLALDRFCAENADYIWDVSPAMQKARIKAGLNPDKSAPVIDVPNGLYPEQIKASPINKINKYDLVYMGTVGPENGPDIAIKTLHILRKKYSKVRLHIIGGTTKDFEWLSKIINKLKLENYIQNHGFIESGIDMSAVIRTCAIGLAPYRAITGSIRWYADAGKIRAYCASGLPVVSSHVPPLGHVVAEKGGALITKDDAKSFAETIDKLFSDEKLYSTLRKNAIIFARYNTWSNSFLNAFRIMESQK